MVDSLAKLDSYLKDCIAANRTMMQARRLVVDFCIDDTPLNATWQQAITTTFQHYASADLDELIVLV